MNLRLLSDDQLHTATVSAAQREREETIHLLKHLSEVERRHLYSKFKCDSLHAYCVDHLKMSDAHAGRRVSAARLMRELPAIEEKILTGSIPLTSVSQANTFFNKEARAGNKFEQDAKLQVLAELENISTREAEKILLSKSSQPEIHFKESVKPKTESLTEIKILVDEKTLEDLNRLKDILSHEMPAATFAQIISKLAQLGLEKLDPNQKAKRAIERKDKRSTPAPESAIASEKSRAIGQTTQPNSSPTPAPPRARTETRSPIIRTPAPESKTPPGVETSLEITPPPERSRYIPAPIKHAVWMRDKGQCTFTDPRTGEICGSRRLIECDHVIPFAKGGAHSAENLRLRCRAHNQRHAMEAYGASVQSYWGRV